MVAMYVPALLGADAPLGEILLAETAIRIELPVSLHQLAVDRYAAIRDYIERDDSPLFDRVELFYPQGSMAIGATIKARTREDGFDIDIIAELRLPASTPPAVVLDTLYQAVRGQRGSRYWGKTKRQTRCVTVEYDDGMHLDVTPSILTDAHDPRRGLIFHAKPEEAPGFHKALPMNTHGFIEWFNDRTPVDMSFAEAYSKRALAHSNLVAFAAAEVTPVPDHSSKVGGKSSVVVALQLLKRNRNIRYAARSGRMPPSVMMACCAATAAAPGDSIGGALTSIVDHMLLELEQAQKESQRVEVYNPACEVECFTDRWPENLTAQKIYIDDLHRFRKQLSLLMNGALSLPQMNDLLTDMFGEGPAKAAVEDYGARIGRGIRDGSRRITPSGRVALGVAGGGAASSPLRPAAAHTFFGGVWRGK